MSLDKYGKNKPMLNRDTMSEIRTTSNMLLVFMMLFQLILPVIAMAGNSSTDNDAIEPNVVEVQSLEEEEVDADIESPKSLEGTTEDAAEDIEETTEVDANDSSAVDEKEEKPVEEEKKPIEKEKLEENKAPPVKEEEKVVEKEKADAPKSEPENTEKEAEENQEPKEEVKEESKEEVPEVKEDDSGGLLNEASEKLNLMLDGFSATAHPENATPLTMFAAGSLGSAAVGMNANRMMSLQAENLQPGEVRTSKTATPVPGMVNTWDITVRVEGRDNNIIQTTDIVLVLDRSGSMEGTRLANLKIAGENFIDQTIPYDPGIRIAIVSFSSDYQGAPLYRIDHQFSDNTVSLKAAMNSLVALGGTHTQAGITQGRLMMNGSSADNKYMILLSDGEPTYSYEPNNWTQNYDGTWPGLTGSGGRTNYFGVYNGSYGSSVVGTGSTLTDSYNSGSSSRRHIHNGLAAIRAGQDARIGLDKLYTIGIGVNNTTADILQQIASPGGAYRADRPEDLPGLYNELRTQIMTQSALRDAVVHDEMGDGFSLVSNTLATTEGVTSIANANNTNNDTITWDLSPHVDNLVPGTTDVRYAEMTYRVEINPEILNAPIATPGATTEHDLYKTNKVTQLSYTDIYNQTQGEAITSPEVDPVLLRVKKNLIDADTNEGRRFVVRISNDGVSYNEVVELIPNDDYLWLTTLRHEGTYNVEEVNVIGSPATPLSQFITHYEVDGMSNPTFDVYHNGAIPRGDIVIDVTNREIRKIDITGTKIWQGGPAVKPAVTLQLYRNGVAHRDPVTLNHPTTTHTWTDLDEIDANGGTYQYTVQEVNPPAGYESSVDGLTVTNIYQIPSEGTAIAIKIWEGSNPDDFSAIPLTLWRTLDGENFELVPNVSPMITQDPIVNPNEHTYRYVWNDLVETDFYGNPYTFYFTENDEVNGYERTYLDTTETATIDGVLMTLALSGGRVRNREMNLDFTFMKVDEVGNALPGAVFDLHRHDGTDRILVERLGEDTPVSTFNFTGLTQGTYTLTEVSSPEGYVLPEDNTWTFEVVWNEAEKRLEIVFEVGDEIDGDISNHPVGMLPETGGPGNQLSILISMMSLLSLATIYLWRNQRDEVKQND